MHLDYRGHRFSYEQFPRELLDGRLLLNTAEQEELARLIEAEDEDWYLDDEGERLPAGELFDSSPWGMPTPNGVVKLVCRILDLRTGRAMFSAPESYLEGGLYGWLRDKDGTA